MGSENIAGKEEEVEVQELELRLERMGGEERALRRDVSFFCFLDSFILSFEVEVSRFWVFFKRGP